MRQNCEDLNLKDLETLRAYLAEDILAASPKLLGCTLVRGDLRAQIVEVEAYTWDDPGCHAYNRTAMKNMAMYGRAGTAYVYFTYGNHWMLNVVGDIDGRAGAVLIRGAMPIAGHDVFWSRRPKAGSERGLLSGPGKIAAAFDIDSRLNQIDLLDPRSELHIELGSKEVRVGLSRRIGIAPGKGDELIRRYVDLDLIEWATKSPFNREALAGAIKKTLAPFQSPAKSSLVPTLA
ncbi:MAG TPA: DNA-3-methyladenine glycosylase [Fimbriimonas sp.]|nr:DNA-3-methyladenine glycosylase [Fimbriimonas sp.]